MLLLDEEHHAHRQQRALDQFLADALELFIGDLAIDEISAQLFHAGDQGLLLVGRQVRLLDGFLDDIGDESGTERAVVERDVGAADEEDRHADECDNEAALAAAGGGGFLEGWRVVLVVLIFQVEIHAWIQREEVAPYFNLK